ncbi:hypothetical protein HYH03_006851 [Edaphochlamys debaryana]|uniref:MSP domain-containing protein n=1 Tax=Edaphochlamys debaryana TaxID=47281 RepID=A0A835Y666_9CHLO|nr:hypothetical protein HYH03_006851 [Edaphochlamys debaryana]|eukprot:KAG2494916.1 hypothetical protein HYH03_006851 [Edaphochlamys debaryana]
MSAPAFVLLEPEELQYRDVKLSQVYAQTVQVTNTLRGPVELTIRPGSTDRYTVVPSTLRLRGGESGVLEVRLRVLRFAQRQKAVEQGQRDVFHVKGSHFDQKFYATFWLAPEPEGAGKARPAAGAAVRPRPELGSDPSREEEAHRQMVMPVMSRRLSDSAAGAVPSELRSEGWRRQSEPLQDTGFLDESGSLGAEDAEEIEPPSRPPLQPSSQLPQQPAAQSFTAPSPATQPTPSQQPRGDTLELQLQVRTLERQHASLRRTLEQQQDVIRDKDSMLQALQNQLQAAKGQQAARESLRQDPGVEQTAAERVSLLNERSLLTARLAEAEAALATSRDEATSLRRLQLELQSRHPDVTRAVEAAVAREQAQQEDRNRKALEMLMAKDGRIQELEAQAEELTRAHARLQAEVAELQERLQSAEGQVVGVLRQKEALVESSRLERERFEQTIADLEARLAAGSALSMDLLSAQEHAAAAEQRAATAEQRAAAAERRAVEAQARAEGADAVQRRFQAQQDEHVGTALAMAEELRARSVDMQERHAEAMRLQADAHRRQVALLEARISELAAEAARAQAKPGRDGGAGPGPAHVTALDEELLDSYLAGGPGAGSDPRDLVSAMSGGGERARTGVAKAQGRGQAQEDREEVNGRLMAEVQELRRQLSSLGMLSKERAREQAELDRLRRLLPERDLEVADLTSQLAVLQAKLDAAMDSAGMPPRPGARAGARGPGQAGSSPAASPLKARPQPGGTHASPSRGRQAQHGQATQAAGGGRGCTGTGNDREAGAVAVDGVKQTAVVEALRKRLAKSEAALRSAQERNAVLEARAAVAHESAGRGEEQLEAVHRSMVGSALERQRLQQELEAAHDAAARLNARVSDLALGEQVARAEVDAARAKLGQLQELHGQELAYLQEQLHRLTDHLAATQPEVLPVLLGPDHPVVRGGPGDDELGAFAAARLLPGISGGGPVQVTREAELQKAVDAAETAVAVMQARLLAALQSAADAGEEVARLRREAEWERDKLEAEVRYAREEGALRIRTLEESVARLGARGGEAAQALARSAAEADAAVRRESRLRSELALTQQAAQRSNTQVAELRLQLRDCEAALREAQVYGSLLPFLEEATTEANAPDGDGPGPSEERSSGRLSGLPTPRPSAGGASVGPGAGAAAAEAVAAAQHEGAHLPPGAVSYHVLDSQLEVKLRKQAAELARRQQVIARLVDVAERAQAEAAATQTQLDQLKQALPDPKQPLQQQFADVQRNLGASEAELRICRDAKSSCELEVARLRLQLAERTREVDHLGERLAACERDVGAKEDVAARKAIEVRGAMAKEVAALTRRVAESQRALDEAETRAHEAEAQLGNVKAELTTARAELEAQAAQSRLFRHRAREEKAASEDSIRQLKRALEGAKQESQERRSQLTVMMETIEVLQAGNPGEREQRIVSLTAQLSAAASREGLSEQRAEGLLADLEASTGRVQQLQAEAEDLRQQAARLEQELAAAASQRLSLDSDLAAARADVRSRDAAALRSARDLDDREQRVAGLEAELEALRRALNDCQARHAEQLAKEREESAALVRQARAESSIAAATTAQDMRLERFQASLDDLVAWIEARTRATPPQSQQQGPEGSEPQQDPAAQAAPNGAAPQPVDGVGASWVMAALERLKGLALESEREFLSAATDARLYRFESRWAWARVQRLQAALEQRTGEWNVAQAKAQLLERTVARLSDEAAIHAIEHIALQDKQVALLNERLQATTAKLVVATAQAAGAEAALAAARNSASTLQRQAEAAQAECRELAARLAAAEMESAGSAEALHLGTEAALAQRDLSIRQYWDGQVAALLAKPDARDKVLALAREVCALKLSESQLQAALAASKHRCDAASQRTATLAAALRAAEDKAEQLLQPTSASTTATATTDRGSAAAAGVAAAQGAGLAAVGVGMELARLSAQLAAQSHEMFRLQEAALRSKQAYERRESDLQELHAQLAAAELLLSQVRAEGSAALLALREQLTETHEQDRQLLMREMRELQSRLDAARDAAAKDLRLAEQRVSEVASAVDADAQKRLSEAMADQVDGAQFRDLEARGAKTEREAARLGDQIQALQDALTAAQAEVTELQDVRDVTGAAVASLEATLARIEKAAAANAAAGAKPGAAALAGGARRVPASGAVSGQSSGGEEGGGAGTPSASGEAPQGLAGLSRELVRAKMGEADAVRKMRAVARTEVDLRKKLLQRDERIAELKDQLAAKSRSLEELRRRALSGGPHELGPRPAGSHGAAAGATPGGAAGKPGLRSRSPSPVRAGLSTPRQGSSAPPVAPRRSSLDSADARAAAEAADAEHLAAQVSQLRVEVAKRQAEVERLQAALAVANAAAVVKDPPRPPAAPAAKVPTGAPPPVSTAAHDRLKDQLASANAEIAAALSTTNSLLRRLSVDSAAGPTASTAGSRRAGSPARRLLPGSVPAQLEGQQLAPGTLTGALQQLSSAVHAALRTSAASQLRPLVPLPLSSETHAPVLGIRRSSARPPAAASGLQTPSGLQTLSALNQPLGAESPTRGGGSSALAVYEDLRRTQRDKAALERERDELSGRCAQLERELRQAQAHAQAPQARGQAGAAAASQQGAGGSAEAASRLAGATHLSKLLEGSASALHRACDGVQAAVGTTAAPGVRQAVGSLVSELETMDATLKLLSSHLDKAAQDSGHPTDGGTATAVSTPASSISLAPSPTRGGAAPAPAPAPGNIRRRIEPPPVGLFLTSLATSAGGSAAASGRPGGGGGGEMEDVTPRAYPSSLPGRTPATASSWETVTPGTAVQGAAHGFASGRDPAPRQQQEEAARQQQEVAARQEAAQQAAAARQETTRAEAANAAKAEAVAALAVAQSQAASLMSALAQQKARADKWKQRSRELGSQLSLLNASAAAREAAASERQVASEQAIEQELRRCKAEVSRLQAALSGAEAALREMDAAQSSGSGEVRASLARAAEATARAATLQRQLETERAQAAAAAASHQEEVAALKAAVAQEKGERARLLVSLRESHSSAQQSGNSESQLRTELLQAQSASASARAAAERAGERAAVWRSEADSLRQRLGQLERGRSQLLSSLEARLDAAERRAAEAGGVAGARLEELTAKLAAAQAEVAAAPLAAEAQLRQLEAQLSQAQVDSFRQLAHGSVQAGRWASLARVVRSMAAVKALSGELEARTAEWEREKAGLQVAADEALRSAEALASELVGIRAQAAELQSASDADRQQLAARHVAHEMQRRIEQERQAMAAEADARAAAAALASESSAEAAAAARLAAVEGELRGRVGQLEAERFALARELELMQAQFGQYQAQKASEVAELDRRIQAFIAGGAVDRGGGGGAGGASGGGGRRTRPTRAHADAGGCGGAAGGAGSRGAGHGHGKGIRRQGACPGGRAVARRRCAAAAAGGGAGGCCPAAGVHQIPTQLPPLHPAPAGYAAAGPHPGPGQAHPGPLGPLGAPMLGPSQLVALARGAEQLSALQREVAFERSLRGRAEGQAGVLRATLARLRARLKALEGQLEEARAESVSPEEHRQLQSDLMVAREQLKACRLESARRQKALAVLQGMVTQTGHAPDGPGLQPRPRGAPSAGPGPSLPADLASLEALARPGTAPAHRSAGADAGLAAEDDPLPAALEAAVAGARATAAALEAERSARQGVEAKLREARAAVERKTALARDLKKRVDELEASAQQSATQASSDAEARAKSLAAALARKEAQCRELRERLEAGQAAVAARGAEAEAGGEVLDAARRTAARLKADLAKRDAALRVALADLEQERKMVSAAARRLDATGRREAEVRRAAAAAAGALRGRAGELLEGLRALCRALLQAVAAMDVASERLAAAPAAAVGSGSGGGRPAGRPAAAAGGGLPSADDISALTSLSIEDVRHLLGPDAGPLARGGGGGGGGGQGGAQARLQQQQPYPLSNGAAASAAAVAASLDAAQRVGDLLGLLEVALAAAADLALPPPLPTAGTSGEAVASDESLLRDQLLAAASAEDPAAAAAAVLAGNQQQGRRPDGGSGATAVAAAAGAWDGRALAALLERVTAEASRAEGALAAALAQAGAL